jgi:RNA polymerase sigma-70 factor (ECF subfamily)
LFSSLKGGGRDNLDESEYSDPLEFIESNEENLGFESGESLLERQQLIKIIESEISKLPARQREAFLMRYWDDLGISETAKIMACSEGSVKTHCSRASITLAKALKKQGFKL